MSICDALENWDDLTPEERFEQMKEWAQGFAEEWGIDPPDILNSDAPPGNAGSGPAGYDPDTNTIYLGPDFFSDDSKYSPEFVTGEAAHETRHAMQYQYYGEDTRYAMPRSAREADALDFGDAVKDFANDECDPGDDSAPEDPGGDDDDDWFLAEEDDEEDESRPPDRPNEQDEEEGEEDEDG
jgi:hypothetical protein